MTLHTSREDDLTTWAQPEKIYMHELANSFSFASISVCAAKRERAVVKNKTGGLGDCLIGVPDLWKNSEPRTSTRTFWWWWGYLFIYLFLANCGHVLGVKTRPSPRIIPPLLHFTFTHKAVSLACPEKIIKSKELTGARLAQAEGNLRGTRNPLALVISESLLRASSSFFSSFHFWCPRHVSLMHGRRFLVKKKKKKEEKMRKLFEPSSRRTKIDRF